jgi:hypothetical protein
MEFQVKTLKSNCVKYNYWPFNKNQTCSSAIWCRACSKSRLMSTLTIHPNYSQKLGRWSALTLFPRLACLAARASIPQPLWHATHSPPATHAIFLWMVQNDLGSLYMWTRIFFINTKKFRFQANPYCIYEAYVIVFWNWMSINGHKFS